MPYYDRADWHYGGDYPRGLPEKNAATHIGMFLAWAFMRGLHGKLHEEHSATELAEVRARRMKGSEFLLSMCDEKFSNEDLNQQGNAFARDYYDTNHYLDDYNDVLGADLPTLYHVEDSWENFDKLAPVLDARFAEWKARAPA